MVKNSRRIHPPACYLRTGDTKHAMPNESINQSTASADEKPYRGGPRTMEGKARARYNGTKHGLTGRTVVLPWEDMEQYKRFSEELVESFAPQTPFERQLAQTIADAQWRLNRARTWEEGMLCMGVHGVAGNINTEDPGVHTALAESQVFEQNSKCFTNLTLYEQRLHRQQKQALEQLEELQKQRKAEEQAALDKAKLVHKFRKMKGTTSDEPVRPYPSEVEERRKANGQQFAFSTALLDAECALDQALGDAKIGALAGFKLKNYEALVAKMAA